MTFLLIIATALCGALIVGAAIIGQPRKFHHRYRFVMEIQGFESSAFRDISGLKANVGLVEHWEGGRLIAYKEAGRITFDNLTCTRGVTIDQDAYAWFKKVARLAADSGNVNPEYKKDCSIVQYDRDGRELRRWSVHQAFPIVFEAGSWDNTTDEAVIETLELAYDYFDQPGDN